MCERSCFEKASHSRGSRISKTSRYRPGFLIWFDVQLTSVYIHNMAPNENDQLGRRVLVSVPANNDNNASVLDLRPPRPITGDWSRPEGNLSVFTKDCPYLSQRTNYQDTWNLIASFIFSSESHGEIPDSPIFQASGTRAPQPTISEMRPRNSSFQEIIYLGTAIAISNPF